MTTYVAFLRGINVGGAAKVAMPALKALFESAGYEDVRTYINSGNVLLRSARKPDVAALETRIAKELGVPATVVVRSAAELRKVVAANPYSKEPDKAVYVTFLAAPPSRTKVDAPAGDPATFEIEGREVYVHSPTGYSNTKLSNAFFEKHLGVDATTRGMPTLLKLLDMTDG
jgi:uncharacterized protein (DUF1697 family)